jgi:hypothetical protein
MSDHLGVAAAMLFANLQVLLMRMMTPVSIVIVTLSPCMLAYHEHYGVDAAPGLQRLMPGHHC